MVQVGAANRGVVRFSNCAFWGPCHQIAKIAGGGTVGFSDCTFCDWDHANEGRAAVQAAGGSVLVRGCEFQKDATQVELGTNVQRAVISTACHPGQLRVVNHSARKFQIHDNAPDAPDADGLNQKSIHPVQVFASAFWICLVVRWCLNLV